MKPYQLDIFYDHRAVTESRDVIQEALSLLTNTIKRKSFSLTSCQAVKSYCRLHLATREHEIFGALFLDSQHRLIEFRELFRGTIDGCSVYVREVAKEALSLNAAAIIFTHNHPSGVCEPSQADIQITKRLQEALTLFDVRVLDHFIVSAEEVVSFAERGLM
ncbi:MAG: DNA repair protein RadC [Pseudomonadales bacterium]|nr:DNA repair protein RadC [Pseudomonadales bacterium]